MTRPALLIALMLGLATGNSRAEGERAGDFDYYVLSLSWSPGWCAATGDARDSPQCRPRAGFGWVLHGLWPQDEGGGWPSYCRTRERDPTRDETAAMADIMGTPGAAWHQWQKHGRCSGLSAPAYFGAARLAFARLGQPGAFASLRKEVRLPARVVEEAFLQANSGLSDAMITVTCEGSRIQEVRLCLTRRLEPRPCGEGVRRDCRLEDALMEPVR